MITGDIGVDQMSGPVGIVKEVNTAVNSGSNSWLYVLNLTALLTINLGVFNLLPIPALDGGHVFFLLYEMITGRKPGDKFLTYAEYAGFTILLLLLVVANLNDVLRLFGII